MVQFFARRIALGERQQREIAAAEDAGEEVVEVVRDARGETAHGLDLLHLAELFLRLAERGLGALTLAEVGDHREPDPPVECPGADGAHFDFHDGSILALVQRAPARWHVAAVLKTRFERGDVFGRTDIVRGEGEQFLARISVELHGRLVGDEDVERLLVDENHGKRRRFEQRAIPLLIFAEHIGLRLDRPRHRVELLGEHADLAARPHAGAAGEVAAADGLGVGRERDDGPADPSGDERGDEERQGQAERAEGEIAFDVLAVGRENLRGRHADDDGPRRVRKPLPRDDAVHAVERARARAIPRAHREDVADVRQVVHVAAHETPRVETSEHYSSIDVDHRDGRPGRERSGVDDGTERVDEDRRERDGARASVGSLHGETERHHPYGRVGVRTHGLADGEMSRPHRVVEVAPSARRHAGHASDGERCAEQHLAGVADVEGAERSERVRGEQCQDAVVVRRAGLVDVHLERRGFENDVYALHELAESRADEARDLGGAPLCVGARDIAFTLVFAGQQCDQRRECKHHEQGEARTYPQRWAEAPAARACRRRPRRGQSATRSVRRRVLRRRASGALPHARGRTARVRCARSSVARRALRAPARTRR